MNIHLFPSSFNGQEPSQKSPKLSSPSYTKTNETLYNNFIKSDHTFMTPNRNLSRETIKKDIQNSNSPTSPKPTTKQPDSQHYLTIDNIKWNHEKAFFTSDLELQVQYTVTKQLEENVQWQVTYFGSAYSEQKDQVLIEFETEENEKSSRFPEKRQFKLSVQPPKWHLISPQELFSTTAITISAFYKGQQFLKVGYYIHYLMPQLSAAEKKCIQRLENQENPIEKQDKRGNLCKKKKITKKCPKKTSSQSERFNRETQGKILEGILSKTVRTILGDKPRIVKFEIDWEKQLEPSKDSKILLQGESTEILHNQHLITQYLKPQQFLGVQSFSE